MQWSRCKRYNEDKTAHVRSEDELQKGCRCHLCTKQDDTSEHVMECRRENSEKQHKTTEKQLQKNGRRY